MGEIVPDASEWQTAASFVVVFSQRQVGDACDWMLSQLNQAALPERRPAGRTW